MTDRAVPQATCSNCPFWDQFQTEGDMRMSINGDEYTVEVDAGFCRTMPPVVVGAGIEGPADGGWPTTQNDDWCSFHPDFDQLWKNGGAF